MKRCIILLLAVLSMLQYKLSAQDSFIYKMQGEKLYLQEDSIYVVINFKSLEYTSDYMYRIVNGGNIIVNDMVVKK